MRTLQPRVACLLTCLLLASAAAAADRGYAVATDAGIFSEQMVATLKRTLDENGRGTFFVQQDPYPRIAAVVARHGEPDKVVEEEWISDSTTQEVTVYVVHYYGRVGLAHPKGGSCKCVEYVRIPRAGR